MQEKKKRPLHRQVELTGISAQGRVETPQTSDHHHHRFSYCSAVAALCCPLGIPSPGSSSACLRARARTHTHHARLACRIRIASHRSRYRTVRPGVLGPVRSSPWSAAAAAGFATFSQQLLLPRLCVPLLRSRPRSSSNLKSNQNGRGTGTATGSTSA